MEFVGKCLVVKSGEKRILVVGDLHLGYEEFLNRSGVFVSRRLFEEMIEYFDRVFERVGKVEEIVLLGDVKHDFGRIMRQEWNDFGKLIEYLRKRSGKIVIVRGNHDKIIGPVAERSGVEVLELYRAGEICFFHGERNFPEIYDDKIKIWVMGHWHPAVKISDGVKVEKYKCFLVGKSKKKEIVIVPSFFAGNPGSDPRGDIERVWNFNIGKFKVFVVSDEDLEVMDFGELRKLD